MKYCWVLGYLALFCFLLALCLHAWSDYCTTSVDKTCKDFLKIREDVMKGVVGLFTASVVLLFSIPLVYKYGNSSLSLSLPLPEIKPAHWRTGYAP